MGFVRSLEGGGGGTGACGAVGASHSGADALGAFGAAGGLHPFSDEGGISCDDAICRIRTISHSISSFSFLSEPKVTQARKPRVHAKTASRSSQTLLWLCANRKRFRTMSDPTTAAEIMNDRRRATRTVARNRRACSEGSVIPDGDCTYLLLS